MSPTLLKLLPETSLPGLTTRRIWLQDQLLDPVFVLLTVNKLYLSREELRLSESEKQQLLVGGQPGELLTPHAICLELSQLRSAELDLEEFAVKLQVGDTVTTIRFREANTADDFYSKLARRVQDRYQVIPSGVNVARAMRSPLAAMAGVLCVMVTLMLTAEAWRDLSEYRYFMSDNPIELPVWFEWVDRFFRVLPPRFIGAVGGVTLAGLQLWAYRRLTQPPTSLEFQLRPDVSTS